MLKIGDKTFLNLQEAVAWLMENNCIPFQCTAPYAANTEIGLGTIVNPSPAKVRIGSIIFFSDSKVSTVTGVTENGFMVSDEYNNLVDDVVYVSNVALDASGHLIVTLSDGNEIDAGQIKMINSFSITASQHLLAVYNDGTTQDLGAIFSGNINIAGTLTADSIIENMVGYSWTKTINTDVAQTDVYVGVVKNGNKLTVVYFGQINLATAVGGAIQIGFLTIPSSVGSKLHPYTLGAQTNVLDQRNVALLTSLSSVDDCVARMYKGGNTTIQILLRTQTLSANTDYLFRYEATFLLSDNLAS